MIDRIEVVRNPASVLYGNKYGSVNYHDTHISVGASVQKDDGYSYSGTNDEFANPINIDYQNNISNLFIEAYDDS